jgi:phage terminase large subunit-like protein
VAKRRLSTRLIELKRFARRKGWASWIRQGEGEAADERAMLNGCWFVPQRANHCIEWIESHCCLVEGAWRGKPLVLQDWQRDFLSRLFGWVRWSSEWERVVRRFRWGYAELPKKNGKSPLQAAVGCYLLFGDGNQSARIFSTATAKKQACIVHGAAIQMVEASPALSRVSKVRTEDGYKAIEYPALGGKWTIAAADARTADGFNGHCLADELHRWNDWEFWTTLRWMLASQPEGLFFAITTAGADLQSICRTQHDRARAVNEGRQFDDQFLGRIWAADVDDDPHKVETWRKANPSLGTNRKAILKLSDFRADYHAAVQDPTQWSDWLRLRLGIWKTAESAWIDQLGGIGRWDSGTPARTRAGKRIDCHADFAIEDMAEWPCWFALDGATHHDTTAAVFVWPDPKQSELLWLVPYYWLPEAEALRLGPKVPYKHWSDAGLITLTPGDAVDFGTVKADLVSLCGRLNVQGFAFDPLFQAEWLTQQIAEDTGVPRVEFPQTITHFSPPMKTLGRLIAERKVRHNGHAILSWQLGHLRCYEDCNGNQRPVRQKRGDHRTIDGCVAAVMALRLATAGETERPTWYDSDDHDVEFM